jgi:hypothetical protein
MFIIAPSWMEAPLHGNSASLHLHDRVQWSLNNNDQQEFIPLEYEMSHAVDYRLH